MLHEFQCSHFTLVASPLEPSLNLVPVMDDPLPDPSLFRRLVGKLNFLQHTRPDISFVVQHLSQFLQTPCAAHRKAGLYVLRYVMSSPAQGIFCQLHLIFLFQLMLTLTGFLALFLEDLLLVIILSLVAVPSLGKARSNLPLLSLQLRLNIVLCVSQAALHIAKNLVFHERTKHIEIDCHYVRDCLLAQLISLHHISFAAQLADIMTKTLNGPLHQNFLCKLGVLTPSSLRGGVNIGPDTGPETSATTSPITCTTIVPEPT